MKRLFFALSLLISIAGMSQGVTPKNGEYWRSGYDTSSEQTLHEGDRIGNDGKLRRHAEPRIAPQWVTMEHEIQELRKEVDSLIKAMRANPFNGARVDSNITKPWYIPFQESTIQQFRYLFHINPAPHTILWVRPSAYVDSVNNLKIIVDSSGWTHVISLPRKIRKKRKIDYSSGEPTHYVK